MAGGIDPDNAVEALVKTGAAGVDVSSGVEGEIPGRKNETAMRKLIAAVKEIRS